MNWRVHWDINAFYPKCYIFRWDWLSITFFDKSILQCCNVNKSGTECNFVSGCPTIEMNQVISVWSRICPLDQSCHSVTVSTGSLHTTHRLPGHCTLALPLWAHGNGWGWSYNGLFRVTSDTSFKEEYFIGAFSILPDTSFLLWT